ncbi:hypothetical protein ACJ8QF_24100 [Serratia sp. CY81684]|uniref:hypothetical protein n=1 Tax=Serratia sp. CY81684 TaxID=3383686 RepID=UPI003FA160F6
MWSFIFPGIYRAEIKLSIYETEKNVDGLHGAPYFNSRFTSKLHTYLKKRLNKMAKPPKVIPPLAPSTAPVIGNLVQDLQLTDWKASSKSGQVTVSGISGRTGQHVRVTTYEGTGFSERTVSTCDPMSLAQRRQETQRLRSTGLSQQQIADRLGVSQKTVSNDLNKK